MKSFEYIIKDPAGLHAKPASFLAKKVRAMEGKVTIGTLGRSVDASKIFTIMSLGIKQGATVTLTVEGGDETAQLEELKTFFRENL